MTEADVRDSALRLAEAEQAVNRLDEGIGRLRQEVEALERLTAEAGALRVAHQERKAQHQLFQRLAQDLGGKEFQQYLLDGSFARLVEGASHRLRELNDRYELRYTDNKFVVLDHDHGAQPRLADTLSGGETVLVSLALALELSEQVQRAAGAVRLDSLFIDEGFGTLDPETLETVVEAIESLSKSNRMIGVITHVPELHRRLPRLEVTPSAAGSTIRYVEE